MTPSLNITVFYIATGKYISMWPDFYASFKNYFLPDCNRRIILFTDKFEDIEAKNDVSIVKIPAHPWPYITLLRFHIFMEHYELWKDSDYVFFMNANYLFKRKVSKRILPKSGLVAGQHSIYWKTPKDKLPYERNPHSTAYIPYGQGKFYFQGALNGGTSQAYAAMCRELITCIDEDLSNDIIAIWHDESHLNRYLAEHGAKVINRYYLWPEERPHWIHKIFTVAILRDKAKMGGHNYMRNIEE